MAARKALASRRLLSRETNATRLVLQGRKEGFFLWWQWRQGTILSMGAIKKMTSMAVDVNER
jgi:hypothetical protein